MKKILLSVGIFLSTFLYGDYLDITLESRSNYHFDEYLFKDINATNTEKLEKQYNFTQAKISGNFNDIIGLNYSINNISSPDKFEEKELYIGSSKTKFVGYEVGKINMNYGDRVYNQDIKKYTIYDILTIEKSDTLSTKIETFSPEKDVNKTQLVYRKLDREKVILSSENLYNHVKENALNGENYFYGVAVSQNFSSWFRFYGLAIASYEQHSYKNGSATYIDDTNGTVISIFTKQSDGTESKLTPVNGKFKGFGYGYKLTAEAYWRDFSIFVTSYYKKTDLSNYHSGIKYPATDIASKVIYQKDIDFVQEYLSFGLNYRF